MKGKDLNKRLRELRNLNEYKPVFIIDQYMELLSPEIKKRGFTWSPYQKTSAVNSCIECEGFDVLSVVMTNEGPQGGWYCKRCRKIVEIKTKDLREYLI